MHNIYYKYTLSMRISPTFIKRLYLGDMLSVDGDADVAVENRIRTGWNKFTHLVPLLTNKDILLKVRGRLYSSCV